MFTTDEAIGCTLALDGELDVARSADRYDRRPGARSTPHIRWTSLAAGHTAL